MSYEFCPACHKYREMIRHVCEPECTLSSGEQFTVHHDVCRG